MRISLLFILLLTNPFSLAQGKSEKPTPRLDEVAIHKALEGDGERVCDSNDFQLLPEALNAAPNSDSSIFAVCPSACGRGGCPYVIFSGKKESKPLGHFFGKYEILPSASHGFYNIRVKATLGSDVENTFVLKFNGESYE